MKTSRFSESLNNSVRKSIRKGWMNLLSQCVKSTLKIFKTATQHKTFEKKVWRKTQRRFSNFSNLSTYRIVSSIRRSNFFFFFFAQTGDKKENKKKAKFGGKGTTLKVKKKVKASSTIFAFIFSLIRLVMPYLEKSNVQPKQSCLTCLFIFFFALSGTEKKRRKKSLVSHGKKKNEGNRKGFVFSNISQQIKKYKNQKRKKKCCCIFCFNPFHFAFFFF